MVPASRPIKRARMKAEDDQGRSPAATCSSSGRSVIASRGLKAMTRARAASSTCMLAAPDQVVDQHLGGQDDDDHRRQVDDEVVERQAGRRADDDVGRVADQGRRAADVGGEDLA